VLIRLKLPYRYHLYYSFCISPFKHLALSIPVYTWWTLYCTSIIIISRFVCKINNNFRCWHVGKPSNETLYICFALNLSDKGQSNQDIFTPLFVSDCQFIITSPDCCRVTYCYSTFLFHYYYSSYYYSSTHFCPLDFSEMPWSNFMKPCRNIICHVKLCF